MKFTATKSLRKSAYDGKPEIVVSTTHDADTDRNGLVGYILADTRTGHKNADRLIRAIEDGKVFVNPTIRTDVHGRTYVECDTKVVGKYMNANLKDLLEHG